MEFADHEKIAQKIDAKFFLRGRTNLATKDSTSNGLIREFLRKEDVPDNNVAIKLFDLSVNMGIQSATIILQRALRAVGISVVEDGVWGPKTQFGIISTNPIHLLAALKSEAAGYYRLIAQKSPTQQKFLSGWLNRAYA